MSAVLPTPAAAPEPGDAAASAAAATPPLSPNARAWLRFKRNRLGYVSPVSYTHLTLPTSDLV